MKTRLRLPLTRALGFAVNAFLLPTALAVTFTSDTTISAGDTSYDGQDVVVSNCTLTVDGPHAFAGLRVAAGGALTHSHWPDGVFSNLLAVADEPHSLGGTNIAVMLHSNVLAGTVRVTDPADSLLYANGTDYLLHDLGGGWTGLERTANSSIPDGGLVSVSYDVLLGTFNAGLDLSVAGDLEGEAGARISADGKGFAGNSGPGRGVEVGWPVHSGGGAGHGGYGGVGWTNTPGGEAYGPFESPTMLGSGGGTGWGGAGGGAIRLMVGGRAIVNGTVSANGANGVNTRSGGGSGGSVWITAETLAGRGSITANGGNGEPLYGGGGAGGRIALEAATNQFAGGLSARGGAGHRHGGAGTVWTRLTGSGAGMLTVDNGGAPGAITPFASTNRPALVVSGGAMACPIGQQTLNSLAVHSNAWLSMAPRLMTLDLVVSGNALLAAGGGIDVVGKGHPAAQGPGAGMSISSGSAVAGSGAGHGGYGGMGVFTNLSRGVPSDALDAPAQPGSGGGGRSGDLALGGAGGGAVRLLVDGTLQLDGSLKPNGEASPPGNGGGGSGGSVWLTAGTLAGGGVISANGGSAHPAYGGGGSGGRIAVYSETNEFAGVLTAFGGTGFQNGAAGTIYVRTNGASAAQILLDNGGNSTTNATSLNWSGTADVTIQGGARASGMTSFRNLTIGDQSALALTGMSQTLMVSGDARIEAGGEISMDGLGYPHNQGYSRGAGRYWPAISTGSDGSGGGGGHGGCGGIGSAGATQASGGGGYGNSAEPTLAGSGGGRKSDGSRRSRRWSVESDGYWVTAS